jgi:hypothetical protein
VITERASAPTTTAVVSVADLQRFIAELIVAIIEEAA